MWAFIFALNSTRQKYDFWNRPVSTPLLKKDHQYNWQLITYYNAFSLMYRYRSQYFVSTIRTSGVSHTLLFFTLGCTEKTQKKPFEFRLRKAGLSASTRLKNDEVIRRLPFGSNESSWNSWVSKQFYQLLLWSQISQITVTGRQET